MRPMGKIEVLNLVLTKLDIELGLAQPQCRHFSLLEELETRQSHTCASPMISNLVTTNLQFGGGVQVLWNQSNQVEISDPTSIFVNFEDSARKEATKEILKSIENSATK